MVPLWPRFRVVSKVVYLPTLAVNLEEKATVLAVNTGVIIIRVRFGGVCVTIIRFL